MLSSAGYSTGNGVFLGCLRRGTFSNHFFHQSSSILSIFSSQSIPLVSRSLSLSLALIVKGAANTSGSKMVAIFFRSPRHVNLMSSVAMIQKVSMSVKSFKQTSSIFSAFSSVKRTSLPPPPAPVLLGRPSSPLLN